jgi:integrase
MEKAWKNKKHRDQWYFTLSRRRDDDGNLSADGYSLSLVDLAVDELTTEDVLKALNPIWTDKPETASRLRGRIERVLDFAKAKGWRSGENPAFWRGHLKNVLPARRKLSRGHHAAMPYDDVPAFVGRLHGRDAMAALALEFAILTTARSDEVYKAQWSEIDLDGAVWTVPASRMKGGREHRVPLSARALEILRGLNGVRVSDYVFPGQKRGRPLSSAAMDTLLTRMKEDHFTVHGFRSSFRDWCGDRTTFPRDIAEAALAHKVGDDTERAYRRSDALEKRRKLMQAWADYLSAPKTSNVTQFRRTK